MTEAADTRNWQTLPHTIYYTRVPLKAGRQTLTIAFEGKEGTRTEEFTYQPARGRHYFIPTHRWRVGRLSGSFKFCIFMLYLSKECAIF